MPRPSRLSRPCLSLKWSWTRPAAQCASTAPASVASAPKAGVGEPNS